MNRHQKKFLGTAVAILNVAFSLSVGAIATYAWFQTNSGSNLYANPSNFQISARSVNVDVDYMIYKYDFVTEVGISSDDADDFFLPPYEMVLKDESDDLHNNSNSRVMVMLKIDDLGSFDEKIDEIRLVFEQQGNHYITKSNNYDVVSKYTSNVIQFKTLLTSYKTELSNDEDLISFPSSPTADDIYTTLKSEFDLIETPTTFVNVNGNNFNKKQTEDLIITPYLPSLPAGDMYTEFTFFVEASYNERLIKHYLETHQQSGLDESLSNYSTIAGDLTGIYVDRCSYTAGTSNSGKYVKLSSNYNLVNGNYLVVHRDTVDDELADGEAKVLNGALASNASKIGSKTLNSIDADVLNDSIVAQPMTNNASVMYQIEDSENLDYKTLKSRRYQDDGNHSYSIDKAHPDDNIRTIGNEQADSSSVKMVGYNTLVNDRKNDISVNSSDGYADIQYYRDGWNGRKHMAYSGGFVYQDSFPSDNEKLELFRYSENAKSLGVPLSLSIEGSPKTIYSTSDTEISLANTHVMALYSDGGKYEVTNSVEVSIVSNSDHSVVFAPTESVTITDFLGSPSSSEVAIRYAYKEYGMQNEVYGYTSDVLITGDSITGFALKTSPTRLNYYEGELLDLSGLVVSVLFNSGSYTKDVALQNFESNGITVNPADGTRIEHENEAITNDQFTKVISVSYRTFTPLSINLTVTSFIFEWVESHSVLAKPNDGTFDYTFEVYCKPNQTVTWDLSDGNEDVFNSSTSDNKKRIVTVSSHATIGDEYELTASITSLNLEISCTFEIAANPNGYFERVDSTLTDYSGTYLIVNEEGNTPYIFDGSSTTLGGGELYGGSFTIKNNHTIDSDSSLQSATFSIESTTNGYAIKSASGNYIKGVSGDNKNKISDTYDESFDCSIGYSSGGTTIVSNTSTFAFNSNGNTFRFYKSGSGILNNDDRLIQLYKYVPVSAETNAFTLTADKTVVHSGTPVTITASDLGTIAPSNIVWRALYNETNGTQSSSIVSNKPTFIWTPQNLCGDVTIKAADKTDLSVFMTIKIKIIKILSVEQCSQSVTVSENNYNFTSDYKFSSAGLTISYTDDGTNAYGEDVIINSNTGYTFTHDAISRSVPTNDFVSHTITIKEGINTEGINFTLSLKIIAQPTTVTDTLNYSLIGVSGTSYTSWSGKSSNSNAVYAGVSAGGNSSIQLRASSSNEGIVSTTSGGELSSIEITFNNNTSSGRTIQIYGSTTQYTSSSELYSPYTQGTLLGEFEYDPNNLTVVLENIDDGYTYIGIRSRSSALYLDEVKIIWRTS